MEGGSRPAWAVTGSERKLKTASVRKREWDTPNGTATAWLVDYTDNEGKRRNKQFPRRKYAVEWMETSGWEVRQGVHTPDSQSITVADAAKLRLARCSSEELEPTTIAAYEQHVRLHIVPICGALKLSRITEPKSEKIRDQLIA